MWEYMERFPDRKQNFNSAMQAQSAAVSPRNQTVQLPYYQVSTIAYLNLNPIVPYHPLTDHFSQMLWTIDIFPFATELSKVPTSPETVLVVDVGGGKGHASSHIRATTKHISGRVILQDLPSVIEDITESLPGVERMPYDFFTPQPIKDAKIYYIRRCLHDWPDMTCVEILKNIAEAMGEQSRCLISEAVIPETGADVEAGWLDLTMMTLTGMERTKGQWLNILEGAGLEFVRTWNAKGTSHGVVEARKKTAEVKETEVLQANVANGGVHAKWRL